MLMRHTCRAYNNMHVTCVQRYCSDIMLFLFHGWDYVERSFRVNLSVHIIFLHAPNYVIWHHHPNWTILKKLSPFWIFAWHVWRQGLFVKMRDAGIHSNMYRWINNFLTDRTIAIQIEGVTSRKECLKEGTPEGSSLSCTLVTLYVNDIVKYIPYTHTALYAEDRVLLSTSASIYSAQANVNTSLRNLWTYCNPWKLKFTNKIVCTILSRRYKVEKSVKIRYGGE